jgi:hypothetical protein
LHPSNPTLAESMLLAGFSGASETLPFCGAIGLIPKTKKERWSIQRSL